MRWKIEGADRESGESRVVWLESLSRESALEQALSLNILVSNVEHEFIMPVHPPIEFPSSIQVSLPKQQLNYMRITPWIIGKGIFYGLLLWAVAGALVVFLFWIFAAAAVAISAL